MVVLLLLQPTRSLNWTQWRARAPFRARAMRTMAPPLAHLSTLLMFSEDSRIWTFSVSVSVGLVSIVAVAIERYLARRRKRTNSSSDTS